MKSAAIKILLAVVGLALVAVYGLVSWATPSKEEKEEVESSLSLARAGKARLKVLREQAENLGIDYFGLSAEQLQINIDTKIEIEKEQDEIGLGVIDVGGVNPNNSVIAKTELKSSK
jgi:nucleotide-binding universal stress UspA family protein